MSVRPDLVIRNCIIVDGRGGEPYAADLAVRDGIIVQIGGDIAEGVQEFDAEGCHVTPGFVDIHTHYDGQAVWSSEVTPSSWHGVTTVVMGNCGVGFAPVRQEHREGLIELMEGVEDIPGPSLHAGLDFNWESFNDYLNVVDQRPHDVDIAALLPHAPLRVYVMGERAFDLEPATSDDIAKMRDLATEAMKAGALGFSTTRTIVHKTSKGSATPSLRAERDELIGIAAGMRDAGHGIIEFISDWDTPDIDTEFGMLREMVETSGCPALFSLNQRYDRPDMWRDLLRRAQHAVDNGVPMHPVVAARPVGLLFSIEGTQFPFAGTASYHSIEHLPLDERVTKLRDPEFRKQVLSEDKFEFSQLPVLSRLSYDRMFRFTEPVYDPDKSESVAAIAEREGRDPAEVALDILLEEDGRRIMFAPVVNYFEYNLDAAQAMLADPNALPGLGDGGAHVGYITDASFSTYLFSYWVRERGVFDLASMVKRQTADTAKAVGLLDRGILAPGMRADINIIDFDKLSLKLPYRVRDLPGGGQRLLQRANGYRATFVAGIQTYNDGNSTGQFPGRVVRGPQPAPAIA